MAPLYCGPFGDQDYSKAIAVEVVGPTLYVDIGFMPQIGALSAVLTLDPASPNVARSAPALVDTGASDSCIDDALAQNLGLIVVDRIDISRHSPDGFRQSPKTLIQWATGGESDPERPR